MDFNDLCKVNEQYPAVSTSRYAIHLEKWLKYFPLEQIHIGTGHNQLLKCNSPQRHFVML